MRGLFISEFLISCVFHFLLLFPMLIFFLGSPSDQFAASNTNPCSRKLFESTCPHQDNNQNPRCEIYAPFVWSEYSFPVCYFVLLVPSCE
jgi:hypothetical protein